MLFLTKTMGYLDSTTKLIGFALITFSFIVFLIDLIMVYKFLKVTKKYLSLVYKKDAKYKKLIIVFNVLISINCFVRSASYLLFNSISYTVNAFTKWKNYVWNKPHDKSMNFRTLEEWYTFMESYQHLFMVLFEWWVSFLPLILELTMLTIIHQLGTNKSMELNSDTESQ